ncbi:hypothetical protein E2C01_020763 [Portunus trituberculatus]|uniref:Uncharacterized protein n=1 Tax=Portunus trituberculatus TaxID=210409 RepID=A0A5B7E1G2_PORTR|nr:hypothetical protein [Portunus trituberculatus]
MAKSDPLSYPYLDPTSNHTLHLTYLPSSHFGKDMGTKVKEEKVSLVRQKYKWIKYTSNA